MDLEERNMPLIFQQDINDFAKIGIWELKEAEFFFSMIPTPTHISHPTRRLQYLAGRYLLSELFPDFPLDTIFISETGKPVLLDHSYYFSISHTTQYVAAIVSTKNKVGIDIERISSKIKGVMPRILSSSDILLLNTQEWAIENQAETLMWSIKEAVYKWVGERNVSFQTAINIFEIHPIEQVAIVRFKRAESIYLKLSYQFFNAHCMVWLEA